MEENIVHIVDWPKDQSALLEHHFPKPVDVNILHPVGLNMFNSEEKPLYLNMNMLGKGNELPICIKLCEPICAESNYKVSFNLLGQPFAEIIVQGITRLFNCKDRNTLTFTGQ